MKSILPLLCCLIGLGVADATAAPIDTPPPADAAQPPFCSLTPDGSQLAVEPCRKAPQQMPRRSVMQVIARMPQQKPGAYGRPFAPGPLVTTPPAPLPPNGCSTGACAGMLHVTGAGTTSIDGNGRLCTQHAGFLQCS